MMSKHWLLLPLFAAALAALVAAPETLSTMREACGRHRELLAWEPSYAPVAARCRQLLGAGRSRD